MSFQAEENTFKKLFDICPCKCLNKGILERDKCRCTVKVPQIEWQFWCDQKSDRKMVIGSIDEEVTAMLEKRHARQERERSHKQDKAQEPSTSSAAVEDQLTFERSISHSSDSEEQQEYENSGDSDEGSSDLQQNRRQYPNLCSIMERTGLSNRDACKVINACLEDMGLDQPENFLEATKLRRQRIYWRTKEVEEHSKTLQQLLCIGFDGRINETRHVHNVQAGRVAITKRQDHYVIVAFPQEQYVDHVAPQSGKSSDICTGLLSVIHDTHSTETLCAVNATAQM